MDASEWSDNCTAGCPSTLQPCVTNCSQFNNSSTNITENVNKFYFYETETLTFLWILFILIMVGNSAVVLALATSKSRKSRTNFFIVHLAFADLTVGLISVLTDIFWKMTVSWNAGNVACKIIKFFQILVTYSSTYVLVALSIDRCDAITRPMNFTGSWRRARMLIASAWSLSALFSLPYLYLYKEEMVGEAPSDRLECWIDLGPASNWQLYMILTATSLFLLPAIIIAACYIIIVITIWRKGQNLGLVEPHTSSSVRNHHSMYDGNEVESKRASSRGLIPKAKIKTVKMTFVIVSVFVLCWCPYFIFNLLHVFHLLPETQTNVALSTFIQSLAPLNSAANPIIYCLFSGCDVCRALQRFKCVRWLLRRVFPCCECVQAGSSNSLSRVGTQYTYVSNRTTLKATGSRTTMAVRRGTAEIQERHVTRRCLPGTPQRSTQL